MEDLLVSQNEEVEAILAMYPGDVEVGENPERPQFVISLYPQRGSSGGGAPLENITYVKLHVLFPPMYPKVIPKMTVKESKGLSAQELQDLSSELNKKAEENIGEVMMYPVLLLAEEFLYAHQKKPTGSFHDEMLMRNRLLQERNLQMQMMFKEKERLAIREEILRKQEEMKEEQKRRRDLWRNQGDVIINDNIDASPTKTDSLSSCVRLPSVGRRKRRSISSRRRRSNSEGSDSSLSEGCDLVMLEFGSGKSLQYFYKGEVLGRSDRGTTVYAGISKAGSLVAIYEWRFAIPVDRKGNPLASGNEIMSVEGLLKQLQSLETESNFMQKLEHSNTVLYYGMKIHPATDEPGVIYLYSVEEFVRGHTVRAYLQDPQQLCSMALPLLRHITSGVLEALNFLHNNNIAHRFLRDTSIFLDLGDQVKVCDYGIERKVYDLCKIVNPSTSVDDIFPPSVGRGGKKGDIYRLGLIVLSLLKGRYVDGPEIPQNIPDELQDFLKRCLSTLENNRWTASELLDHPFLKMSIHKGPNIRIESPQQPKEDDGSNDDNDPILPPRIASTIPFSATSRLHNEFQVLEWLGKGGFGDVLKVRNKLDSRIYALKRIKLNPRNKQLNKKITREVKLLSQLNHENVVRYFNSWIETVEEDDTTTDPSTGTISTEPTSPDKKLFREPSVRFQLDAKVKDNQNSLGMFDDIEDMAPPMKDSEWSISIANDGDDADDSEDSSDEVDLFGTSFLRLTNDDSEGVVFESDSISGRNGTSETDDTAEGSYSNRSKRFTVELSQDSLKKDNPSPNVCVSIHREIQYMYIQMEFCEKSTLRTAIDDNLYEDTDRAWRLFREIVEGLVHIHQQGMIHRDLKPVNIFLDSHDHVKIGDFGLATSSILPKLHPGEIFPEKPEDPQSVDFPEESQTGQVGTALYVAPELITKAVKVSYNQKVDIYSLGIILFEMFYHPLSTGMERIRVITALRQPAIVVPTDFDEHLMPQVTHMTRWLLNHDPGCRPTSLELLQSDYLPPPHLEEAELRDIFSRTLKNSQSKAYKFLIASCFLQKVSLAENFTFDMENTRFPQSGNYLKCYHFLHKLKQTVQKIFERHGGVEIPTPILMPKTELYDDNDTTVNLMCHSGNIVSLPHDLRIPFIRYIGRQGISHMRRYSVEKVFRERKVYGLHPRELVECAFDIVDCTPGSLIADAEIISLALEVAQELPWLRNKSCAIRLGHTKLLEGLLIHHGIDIKYHESIKKTLSEIKVESTSSKSQIQTYLCSRGLPEHFITMLFALMEVEGSLPKVSNILKSITKRKSEAASLIKSGLHELEILKNNLEHLGLKCGMAIVPTMVFGSHIYSGLLFQVVCNLRRRKNKMTVDVIAAGGRYDALLESFRSALALESDAAAALSSKEYSRCGVGISISFDKLVAGYDGEDCAEWNRVGTRAVDAIICSVGHPLSKEKLELLRELWSHGIKCAVLECSHTLEAAEEQCKEMGALFMIILKENEFYSNLRVKMWEREMFQERKMTRQEAVELISRKLNGQVTSELLSSSSSVGINRSESVSMKMSSSIGTESNSNSLMTNNAGLPLLNISFVVQEREKLANWKKRYENQVMHHITDVLPKLAKQQHIEVLGLDVNSSVINTLAACLVSSDKEEFDKSVSDVIEKHPRLRKYLQNVCDEIYELWFEKSASVIILYGLIDNSYRVLL